MVNELKEGLRPSDLRDMMLNVVSIDEYKSKIDDGAIVIAFYAKNKEAAGDANRFIQKSHVELLDTEVSSAPDQKGFYLVFVEILLNNKTAKAIADICRDLASLVDVKQWMVRVRGDETPVELSLEKIQQAVDHKLSSLVESLLKPSGVEKVIVNENVIEAFTYSHSMKFSVRDYGSFDAVFNRNNLNECAVNMNSEALRGNRMLQRFLGNQWVVECLGESYVAHHRNTNNLLIISFESLK